ncbi:DUF2141 domain-containing protein [Pseudoalteromonas sp. C2R02]|uniref:DUF2141 domain-containing protein n=1 Tax=Pseudoalteromonas sp. C2R02 TaxID=2841565 RepID=UPI001C09694F|nr:DUF2141 domain-containing protein [Pseudoalteromonas sp. C2R02]MBU2969214.1 DUF2141 domain-containing protein [Pseudoalteromonas sp. C2R02]
MNIITKLFIVTGITFTSQNVLSESVDFTIEGIQSSNGKIYVQLFDSESGYKTGKAALANIVKAKKGSVTITFNELDAGEYGIRYFHDENNNGELETNLFGLPTEGYGYSNNAKANFGPVDFTTMRFSIADVAVKNNSTVTY